MKIFELDLITNILFFFQTNKPEPSPWYPIQKTLVFIHFAQETPLIPPSTLSIWEKSTGKLGLDLSCEKKSKIEHKRVRFASSFFVRVFSEKIRESGGRGHTKVMMMIWWQKHAKKSNNVTFFLFPLLM